MVDSPGGVLLAVLISIDAERVGASKQFLAESHRRTPSAQMRVGRPALTGAWPGRMRGAGLALRREVGCGARGRLFSASFVLGRAWGAPSKRGISVAAAIVTSAMPLIAVVAPLWNLIFRDLKFQAMAVSLTKGLDPGLSPTFTT